MMKATPLTFSLSISFFLLASVVGTANSFTLPKQVNPVNVRGGDMTPLSSLPISTIGEGISAVSSGLQSGPYGVLALTAVSWSVVLPLTLYKKLYGISVAYGFSVLAAGLAILKAFPSGAGTSVLLVQACMFYGARLGSYLLLRDVIRNQKSSIENGPITGRIIFSLSLALFYAFLTTPALYAMRSPVESSIVTAGAGIAWFGAVLEAVADFQKFFVKQSNKDAGDKFVGPTIGAYQISRHPNYLGEILFWTGLFVGGAPSFGSSIIAWVSSTLGLFGIVSIMLQATKGLEKRQKENYGGQENYDSWVKQVNSSLIPFIK